MERSTRSRGRQLPPAPWPRSGWSFLRDDGVDLGWRLIKAAGHSGRYSITWIRFRFFGTWTELSRLGGPGRRRTNADPPEEMISPGAIAPRIPEAALRTRRHRRRHGNKWSEGIYVRGLRYGDYQTRIAPAYAAESKPVTGTGEWRCGRLRKHDAGSAEGPNRRNRAEDHGVEIGHQFPARH
jgi:hypothetical protein